MLSAFIGGGDVTSVVQSATSEHLLNKKWVGTVKIPVAQAGPDAIGQRLALVDPDMPGPDLDFHGIIKDCNAEDGEDADGMVEYTAESSRELWEWRLARDGPSDPDDPGNYISPDFLVRLQAGPLVLEDVLLQSADGSVSALGEGDLFQEMGSFPAGGLDLSGLPMNTPMTIEQLATLLTSTGEVDIVETMIDSGGNMARIDCYDGNYAGIGSGTYAYEPGGNISKITYTSSMAKMVNKSRYLLGPRLDEEHWRRSIEASNTDIPDTSLYTQASLVALIMASRATYGVRQDIRILDSFDNEASAVPFYWRLWQDESLWRAQPRLIVKWKATDGVYPTFDIGAILDVSWWSGFMGGGSGQQRAFGRKVSWDVDGVVSLDEIMTSSDGDTLS